MRRCKHIQHSNPPVPFTNLILKRKKKKISNKAQDSPEITDIIFYSPNFAAKITSIFYPSSTWCETQCAKICPLLPAQLMGGGKEFQERNSLLTGSPGRRSGAAAGNAGQQQENVELWPWRVARSESTKKCLVWERS